jgi:2-methylaconitate cis-trans-isomerase PrpF
MLLLVYEVAGALILFLMILLFLVWQLLKKHVVTVTVVSVEVEAASYDHDDTVKISGTVTVDGVPKVGASVSLSVKDAAGTDIPLPDTTTDADGKFSAAWKIPSDVAPGVCTLTANALGMTATTTFTFNNKKTEQNNESA